VRDIAGTSFKKEYSSWFFNVRMDAHRSKNDRDFPSFRYASIFSDKAWLYTKRAQPKHLDRNSFCASVGSILYLYALVISFLFFYRFQPYFADSLDFLHGVHYFLERLRVHLFEDEQEDSEDQTEDADAREDEDREVIDGDDFFQVFTHRREV